MFAKQYGLEGGVWVLGEASRKNVLYSCNNRDESLKKGAILTLDYMIMSLISDEIYEKLQCFIGKYLFAKRFICPSGLYDNCSRTL